MNDQTPGPWAVEPTDGPSTFATVYSTWLAGALDGTGLWVAECRPSDAHLIAAAPELLAIAQTVAKFHADQRPVDLFQNAAFSRALTAALAKALGETVTS